MEMIEITESLVSGLIKKREQFSHKGTFGTLQLFCGSKNMPGAAFLAASGALRCGVGLVYISTDRCVRQTLQTRLSEAVYTDKRIAQRATAFLSGCGSAYNAKFIKKLLLQEKPVVIDADSLTYLSKNMHILGGKHCRAIITPHAAEMSRLTGKSVEEIERSEASRAETALDFAKKYSLTVLLKGHRTLIATEDGKLFVNTSGNSGLAKGGSGDVLAGMIGAFAAQGYSAEDSCKIAAWLHGKAAESLTADVFSQHGMLPSDIPSEAAKILRKFE